MGDSLAVLADSVADTLEQTVQGGLDEINKVFVCVVLLSAALVIFKIIKHFVKRKTAMATTVTPGLARKLCIRELLWVAVNVLVGGIILVASWKRDVDTNSRLLIWMGILAFFPVFFFVGNHLYRRTLTLKDSAVSLIENILAQVLWVFWTVLAGYYIASEIMNYSWDNLIDLWQNRVEYIDRLIEDLCAVLIVTIRVFLVVIKHKRAVK